MIFFILLIQIISFSTHTKIFVSIGDPEFKKPIMAVYSENKNDNITNIVVSDFELSNAFAILTKDLFPDTPEDLYSWNASGAEYITFLNFEKNEVKIKLFKVIGSEEISSFSIPYENDYIDTSHTISDLIFKKLTGSNSIFKTKIAFIANGSCEKRNPCNIKHSQHKNLFIIDYDGRRLTQLTNHKSISLSPSWSPCGDKIAYSRYAEIKKRGVGTVVNQNLYLYNLKTNKEELISQRLGQNSGASWSPDCQTLAFSISEGDIYKLTFSRGVEFSPLIKRRGLNLEPSFSPEGDRIVFSSSLTGNPEIYIFDIKTKNTKRLTYVNHYNSSPSWSPKGTSIAFAGLDNPFKQGRSYFDIFLVDPNNGRIERLTIASGNNENPTWSPDGRHIVFSSTRNNGSDLYIINEDGTGERRLTYNIRAYSPSWSNVLE